jgi:hypothetical protein
MSQLKNALLLLGMTLLFVAGCSHDEGSSPVALEMDYASDKAMATESSEAPLGLDVSDGLDITDIDSSTGTIGMAASPQDVSVLLGEDHTVTARFFVGEDRGTLPIAGQMVVFTVIDGPNAGLRAVAVTDDLGYATFTYNGAGGLGSDSIQVDSINPKTGNTLSEVITVSWMNATPTLEARFVPIFLDQDNHKFVTITPDMVLLKAENVYGEAVDFSSVSVVSVSSDEPEDHIGDGSTMGDIKIDCPNIVMLRAERMGGDQGRVYTIRYRLSDATGSWVDDEMRIVIVKDSSRTKPVSYHKDMGYSITPECGSPDYNIQF